MPKYKEMCRRFLADEEDFKEENLRRCGIKRQYENIELESALRQSCGTSAGFAESGGGGAEMKQKIKAILWDYDRTLVNSTIKKYGGDS